MAYIKGYKYDIFLSYSHIDNETAFGEATGWIEDFYNNLTVALWQSIGTKEVKIWWDDKRLHGGILFDDAIEDAIKSSAILLCLNSPAYLKSQYCKRELELFYSNIQNQQPGLKIGNHSRILNALLNNIPFQKWPRELNGTSGFHFNDGIKDQSRGHRFDTKSSDFVTQLQDLTDCLVELIEAFSTGGDADPSPKFTIFFADVADTLRTIRKRTITELEKHDYNIIFDVPPPYDVEEHEEAVKEKIEEANLTVHLLDQYPGREIEGEDVLWYPQKQAELGLLSTKPQLIWMPETMNIDLIEEEQYKTFVQGLESGRKLSKKIEYIRGPKSELPKHIIDLVNKINVPAEKPLANGKIKVLLDTHLNDQFYALDMSKSLLEHNIQPYINPQEDDPRKNINILEERISQVNSLIFFYGKVAGDWVSERMKAARQFIVTNDCPIEEFYVYLLPPHKDPGDKLLKQRFIRVNVLNNSDMSQLDSITLQQLLENIKNIKVCHD